MFGTRSGEIGANGIHRRVCACGLGLFSAHEPGILSGLAYLIVRGDCESVLCFLLISFPLLPATRAPMLAPAPFGLVRVTEGKEDDCPLLRLLERERCSRKKNRANNPRFGPVHLHKFSPGYPLEDEMILSEIRQQH